MTDPGDKPPPKIAELWQLLGLPGGSPDAAVATTVSTEPVGSLVREELQFDIGGLRIPGTLLRPTHRAVPGSAVLYCHAHGNRHDIGRRELLDGRAALQSAYGPLLVAHGFTVLCIDMPGFNERQSEGREQALSKALLWRGKTLLGQMLAEQAAVAGYLANRPDVASNAIVALGISMGATLAYWLAALDARIAAAVHLCAFSDIGPLIDTGAHDLHGPYMTVPGMLRHLDMGDIAAMVAPRPQLVACGTADPLTPPIALDPALETVRNAYQRSDAIARLEVIRSRGTGHVETPEMRAAVLRFLDQFV